MVQITIGGVTKLFDPSYGVIHKDLDAFEKNSIAYYGLLFQDPDPLDRKWKFAIRANPQGQQMTRLDNSKEY